MQYFIETIALIRQIQIFSSELNYPSLNNSTSFKWMFHYRCLVNAKSPYMSWWKFSKIFFCYILHRKCQEIMIAVNNGNTVSQQFWFKSGNMIFLFNKLTSTSKILYIYFYIRIVLYYYRMDSDTKKNALKIHISTCPFPFGFQTIQSIILKRHISSFKKFHFWHTGLVIVSLNSSNFLWIGRAF